MVDMNRTLGRSPHSERGRAMTTPEEEIDALIRGWKARRMDLGQAIGVLANMLVTLVWRGGAKSGLVGQGLQIKFGGSPEMPPATLTIAFETKTRSDG